MEATLLNKLILFVNRWYILLLTVIAIIVILPRLGEGSLRDWDEAIYAQVSKEIIQDGNWITLHKGGEPFFEKPPFLMWTIAVFYKFFGVSEFWSRAPSAVAGIFLVCIVTFIGKNLYGKQTGFLAGLILLGCYEFVFRARNGTTDVLLGLFIYTGILAYLNLRNGNPKWWYLVMCSCALAFMTKFWAGLILPLILIIILLIEQNHKKETHNKHFLMSILLAVVIVIPWHLLVYLEHGKAFIDIYLTRDLLERTYTTLEGHYGSPLFYIDFMRRFFSPWFFLIPFAFALGIKDIILTSQRKSIILIISVILVMSIYTFVVSTKLPWYIFPVYPALSVLIANLFHRSLSNSKSDAFIYVTTAGLFATTVIQDKLLFLCIGVAIAIVIVIKKKLITNDKVSKIITTSIFTVFFLSSLISYLLGNHRLPVRPIYGTQVSPVAKIAHLAGKANASKSVPLLGLALEEDLDTYFSVEGPTALFYSNRPIDIAFTWDQFTKLMVGYSSREIIVAEKYIPYISEEYDVLIFDRVYPLVYAKISR